MSASGQPRQVVLETTMVSCNMVEGSVLEVASHPGWPGLHPLMNKNDLVHQVEFLADKNDVIMRSCVI